MDSTPATIEQLAGAIESGATVVALLVGGVWSYRLFVKNRLDKPRAETEHNVIVKKIGTNHLLVHVGLIVKNQSQVIMKITSGEVRLVSILPLADKIITKLHNGEKTLRSSETEVVWPEKQVIEFDWSEVPRVIEPQEKDTFHFDFFAKQPLCTFQVYSYIENISVRRRKIGWNTTTFHDVLSEGKLV